jgi:glucose-fructose oxidoreductase
MRKASQVIGQVSDYRLSRREVLVQGALGLMAMTYGISCAGTSGAAQRAPAAVDPSRRKLGVALLGLGDYASSQLAPALQKTQNCALRGIVSGTPSKIDTWKTKYSIADTNVYDYNTLPRIANNPDIDIVYVVTPTALHAKFVVMAAEAGKHVFCEKPMAMNVAECQRMIDSCRKNHVQLAIGYRMHHEPNTQTVIQYAKDKPYGSIKNVRAVVGDRSGGEDTWRMHPEMGGGALYDLGVYSVNAIRYASGEEPVRVLRARRDTTRPDVFRDVDEITEFELELPSGTRGFGKASRADSDNFLEVEAERGTYRLEPMQAYTGVSGEASDGKKLDREIDSQQAQQMDDDAKAILTGGKPMTPGEEGLRDIRIINAIQEAVKTGNPVTV